jgi:uncharacterized protein YxjI
MLDLNAYFIKEQVGLLKFTDTYDIFDPETNEQIGVAKEEPSGLVKVLRFLINKRMLPTTVNVYEQGKSRPLFSIHRPFTFFRSKVEIRDADDNLVGYFKSKILSLGGGFLVYDKNDNQFADVKGDWKGWNFKFLTTDGVELGTVTKKWAGLAKELFTSADNYVITISEEVEEKEDGNMLLLAAGLAVDVIYKEGGH